MSGAFEESEILCPYCGEPNTVFFEASEGAHQTVTDCTVCCRPIRLDVRPGEDEGFDVVGSRE